MDRSLEERFFDFLGQLEGARSIDDSISEDQLAGGKRADFLLDNGGIILEVKSLVKDPGYKVEERLNPHREREDFPVFYWDADLADVLSYLPDGEAIKSEIFHAITRPVQGALEKADDQIAATKDALELSNGCGVVVILNEDVGVLEPKLIAAKTSQMLLKKKDGRTRYGHIAYVWIISESHSMEQPDGIECLPLILMEGSTADQFPRASDVLDEMQSKWAAFENIPLRHIGNTANFDGLNFEQREHNKPAEVETKIPRHELWRREYRNDPYLRQLAKPDFLAHAGRIMSSLAPQFLKGRKKLPEDKAHQLMIGWTHVLEEAEYRHLDMRELNPFVNISPTPEE